MVNEQTVQKESDKRCKTCGNTVRMLEESDRIIGACEKCYIIATAFYQTKKNNGRPEVHGGTLCRKMGHRLRKNDRYWY